MKTLVLIEKKSQKEMLLESKLFQYLVENSEFEFIETKMITPFKFSYPELKYSEYPHVSKNISYKLLDPSGYFNLNLYTKEYFSSFDRLIVFPDFDKTGIYAALMILKELFQCEDILSKGNVFEDIFYLKLINFRNVSLSSLEEFEAFYRSGYIKKYFEYNFNINSRIFISEILNSLNINSNYILTKYVILTFCLIYNQEEESLFIPKFWRDYMERNKGSGKYSSFDNQIGSPASRSQILENLSNLNLIEFRKNQFVKTDKGFSFWNLLNKKFLDIDLPGRIDSWTKSNEDLDLIKSKIDNYIINLFKLQKRKNKFLKKDY